MHNSVKPRLQYFAAPEGLKQKIRARLQASLPSTSATTRREWLLTWPQWAAAAGVAAVLLLAMVLVQIARRPSTSEVLAEEVVSSHIRSLLANHLSDVASTDQHTVKPWFTGKLDFAPVVKELSSNGFPLVGGRLDYIENRPVAALVYKRRRHTINLFLWPSSQADSAPRTLSLRGYSVVHWTRARMAYWAVSDVNAADLGEFARDIEK